MRLCGATLVYHTLFSGLRFHHREDAVPVGREFEPRLAGATPDARLAPEVHLACATCWAMHGAFSPRCWLLCRQPRCPPRA